MKSLLNPCLTLVCTHASSLKSRLTSSPLYLRMPLEANGKDSSVYRVQCTGLRNHCMNDNGVKFGICPIDLSPQDEQHTVRRRLGCVISVHKWTILGFPPHRRYCNVVSQHLNEASFELRSQAYSFSRQTTQPLGKHLPLFNSPWVYLECIAGRCRIAWMQACFKKLSSNTSGLNLATDWIWTMFWVNGP